MSTDESIMNEGQTNMNGNGNRNGNPPNPPIAGGDADSENQNPGVPVNHLGQLPEYIKRINESLSTLESTHRTLLTLCGFGLLTFSNDQDVNMLFHNGAQAVLPILNVNITFHRLAWLLPLVIFIIYCFYIYRLSRTWNKYIENTEVDFTKTKSSAFDHMFRLCKLKEDYYKPYFLLIFSYLVLIPPACLILIYLFFLKRHSWVLSSFQFVFAFLPICIIAYYFIWSYKDSTIKCLTSVLPSIIVATIFILTNSHHWSSNPSLPEVINLVDMKKNPTVFFNKSYTFSPVRILNCFGFNPFLNLRTKDISIRPIEWTGELKDESKQLINVIGANIPGVNLVGADAERTFMARANLRDAKFERAYLRGANLAASDMRSANLSGAFIRLVNFRNADLRGVNFENVSIEDYNDPTYLIGPNFQGARFDWEKIKFDNRPFPVNLLKLPINEFYIAVCKNNMSSILNLQYYSKNLPLSYLGLTNTDDRNCFRLSNVGKLLDCLEFPFLLDQEIRNGNLTHKTFSPYFSLEEAIMSSFDLSQSTFNYVNLKSAIFINARLQCTQFVGANLMNADFTDADLSHANFENAILTGATFKNCINIETVTPLDVRNHIMKIMKLKQDEESANKESANKEKTDKNTP